MLENWFLEQTQEPPVLASNPQVLEAFGVIVTGGSLVVEECYDGQTNGRTDGWTDRASVSQSVVARWPREKTRKAGLCCWRSCCALCLKSRFLAVEDFLGSGPVETTIR
jgi:hypothetical protein